MEAAEIEADRTEWREREARGARRGEEKPQGARRAADLERGRPAGTRGHGARELTGHVGQQPRTLRNEILVSIEIKVPESDGDGQFARESFCGEERAAPR